VGSAAAFSGYFKGAKDYLQPMVAALALSLPVATTLLDEQREALLIGLVYTAIYLLTSFASRQSAPVARRIGAPRHSLNWGLVIGLLLAGGAGLARAGDRTILPVLFFVLIYVLQNLRKPVGVAVVAERVPEKVLATVLSVESQLESLLAAAVALAVGAVAELVGGNVGLGLAGAAATGLLFLPLLWLRKRDGSPSTPGSGP
jgi:hypothetical protein